MNTQDKVKQLVEFSTRNSSQLANRGWQWCSDDPRDLIFKQPRRLDDQRTWATGVYYGVEDGGPHGLWSGGTLVVEFAQTDSTEVADIGIYIKNCGRVMKLAPGRSFEEATNIPSVMF